MVCIVAFQIIKNLTFGIVYFTLSIVNVKLLKSGF